MPFKPEFVFQGKEGTEGKEDAQAGRADDSSSPGIQQESNAEGSAREEDESHRVVGRARLRPHLLVPCLPLSASEKRGNNLLI